MLGFNTAKRITPFGHAYCMETIWDRLNKGMIVEHGDPGEGEYMEAIHLYRAKLARINCSELGRDEYNLELSKILDLGEGSTVIPPFQCDLGFNISIGRNTLINYRCVLLDTVSIKIGDNVMIGPSCNIVTAIHPKDPSERRKTMVGGRPIVIENDAWLGANVTVLPGITVGEGSVVGAGSVVTKNVASNTTVAGNPARPL